MNILLVDDHALFREGFKLVLEGVWDVAPCVQQAASVEAALLLAGKETFDLIFLDLGLPGLRGMDGLQAIRQGFPGVSVVVLSATDGSEMVRQAMLYGAQAYIPKSAGKDVMEKALRHVLNGEIFVPAVSETCAGDSRLEDILTARQVEVLAELCAGRSNKEIAEYLGMSENTVRVHVSATLHQLGVRSRTEAVLLAKRKGFF